MSNLEHLIENGLSALKRGASYEKWLKTMKDDVNWQGNENISIEQLWAICQYVVYTWIPSTQPERAIKDCRNCKHGNYNDHWDTYFCYHFSDCNDWDKWEPSAEPEKVLVAEVKLSIDQIKDAVDNAVKKIKAEMEVERKKGQWICQADDDIWNCSECDFEIDGTGCIDPLEYLKIYNFCPHCGSYNGGEQG